MADERGKAISNVTTDHEIIREWAESRGGHPAVVKKTRGKEGLGVLRIDFPGYKGAGALDQISWEEFFEEFDSRSLAFLYQDRTASGKVSRFNKIISSEGAAESKGKKKAA